MGGGGGQGGGGTFVRRSAADLQKAVRKSEDQTTVAAFEAELSRVLGDILGSFNGRDVRAVNGRLWEIKDALKDTIDGTFDQFFGGSVAKHTYVDGLSDIDSLVVINDSNLAGKDPRSALTRMQQILVGYFGNRAQVEIGRMAVTVTYADGMVIQLLPTIKSKDSKLLVPSSRREAWSEINPISFREALTRRNVECGSKLVPTIKLAKAINGELPEAQRLSGYHIEALAIAGFKGYKGELKTSAMLPIFFEKARELVLSPIRDSTGQSVHVDEYLGPDKSEVRVALSHILGRISRRMRNATAAGSSEQWRALFGLEQ